MSKPASATTLTNWATRAPPRDGRSQLLMWRPGSSPAHNLGNKMVPVCPRPEGETGPPPKGGCVDAEPNYERFPQVVLRPPPPLSSRDDCFALRFSLMSECAAHALERPEREPHANGHGRERSGRAS